MAQKIVILDRDGVVNYDSDDYIKSADEWLPIPGSLEAIAKLKQAGYKIYIATNQSGIGRGLFSFAEFEKICEKMDILLHQHHGAVDGIFFCPHLPSDNCSCRKPKAGLLQQIEDEFAVSVANCWLVGDSLRDLEAGAIKNCQLCLVLSGKGRRTYRESQFNAFNQQQAQPITIADNLAHFTTKLLAAKI